MKISFVTPQYNLYNKTVSTKPCKDIAFKGDSADKGYHTYPNVVLPEKITRPSSRESTLKKLDKV